MNITILFAFLSLVFNNCDCGLVNWFNGWNDELHLPQSTHTNKICSEKREANPDISQPETGDQIISLLDLENNENPTDETGERISSTKPKRYPRRGYSINNPLVTTSRKTTKSFSLVKRESESERKEPASKDCADCINGRQCQVIGQCSRCFRWCEGDDVVFVPFERLPPINRNSEVKELESDSKRKEPASKECADCINGRLCQVVGQCSRCFRWCEGDDVVFVPFERSSPTNRKSEVKEIESDSKRKEPASKECADCINGRLCQVVGQCSRCFRWCEGDDVVFVPFERLPPINRNSEVKEIETDSKRKEPASKECADCINGRLCQVVGQCSRCFRWCEGDDVVFVPFERLPPINRNSEVKEIETDSKRKEPASKECADCINGRLCQVVGQCSRCFRWCEGDDVVFVPFERLPPINRNSEVIEIKTDSKRKEPASKECADCINGRLCQVVGQCSRCFRWCEGDDVVFVPFERLPPINRNSEVKEIETDSKRKEPASKECADCINDRQCQVIGQCSRCFRWCEGDDVVYVPFERLPPTNRNSEVNEIESDSKRKEPASKECADCINGRQCQVIGQCSRCFRWCEGDDVVFVPFERLPPTNRNSEVNETESNSKRKEPASKECADCINGRLCQVVGQCSRCFRWCEGDDVVFVPFERLPSINRNSEVKGIESDSKKKEPASKECADCINGRQCQVIGQCSRCFRWCEGDDVVFVPFERLPSINRNSEVKEIESDSKKKEPASKECADCINGRLCQVVGQCSRCFRWCEGDDVVFVPFERLPPINRNSEVNEIESDSRRKEPASKECADCINGRLCQVVGQCSRCFRWCEGDDVVFVPFERLPPINRNSEVKETETDSKRKEHLPPKKREVNESESKSESQRKESAGVSPREKDDEVVTLGNPMKPIKNDDIFSKTMYPISTYRDGETKDIICRIVGLSDVSDVETVTIWVTTFSNNPPRMPGSIDEVAKKLENLAEQKLKNSEPPSRNFEKPSERLVTPKVATPELKPRFNDYDDDENDFLFRKKSNNKDTLKQNPSLIEGTLPFLRNSNGDNEDTSTSPFLNKFVDGRESIIGSPNKGIIVQPKEFESDESDENDATTEPTINNIKNLSLFNRLNELKNRKVPSLKSILNNDKTKSNLPRGGFFQNLLKPNSGNTENKAAMPIELSPIDNRDSMRKSNDEEQERYKDSDLKKALQDVKELVENMKNDSQKQSENRLLGSPQLFEKNIVDSILPGNMANKFKKTGEFLKDRAQDLLDSVKTLNGEQNSDDKNLSKATKNMVTNLKNMAQSALNNFENNPLVGSKEPIQTEKIFDEEKDFTETTTSKSKIDKYLQDLKDKRQKMYSPEKFSKVADNLKEKINNIDPLKNIGLVKSRMAEKVNKNIDILKTRPISLFNNNKENPEQLVGNPEQNNNLGTNDINNHYFLPTPIPTNIENTESNQNKFMKYLENLRSKTTEKPKKDMLKGRLKEYVNSLRNQNKDNIKNPQLDTTKKISDLMRKASENQKETVNELKNKLEQILAKSGNPIIGKTSPTKEKTNNNDPVFTKDTVGASNPIENPSTILENRNNFEDNNGPSDWPTHLGKIVKSSSKPQDIFFIGNGVKLPLKVQQTNNGSMNLSVDLEKLCSCYNATCTNKNQTVLDETVGAILEKEAVLEEQRKKNSDGELKRQKRMSNFLENDVQKELENAFKTSVNQLQDDVKNLNKKLVDSLNSVLPNEEFGGIKNNILLANSGILTTTQNPLKDVNELQKKLKTMFPEVAKIQNQISQAGDVTKISEAYQKVKINDLENRLKKLDNEIEKLEESNEEKIMEESRKFLKGDQEKRVQKEANILSKIIYFVDGLTKNQ